MVPVAPVCRRTSRHKHHYTVKQMRNLPTMQVARTHFMTIPMHRQQLFHLMGQVCTTNQAMEHKQEPCSEIKVFKVFPQMCNSSFITEIQGKIKAFYGFFKLLSFFRFSCFFQFFQVVSHTC
jgi:hypothetical protein